jgi:hypothetical protein
MTLLCPTNGLAVVKNVSIFARFQSSCRSRPSSDPHGCPRSLHVGRIAVLALFGIPERPQLRKWRKSTVVPAPQPLRNSARRILSWPRPNVPGFRQKVWLPSTPRVPRRQNGKFRETFFALCVKNYPGLQHRLLCLGDKPMSNMRRGRNILALSVFSFRFLLLPAADTRPRLRRLPLLPSRLLPIRPASF